MPEPFWRWPPAILTVGARAAHRRAGAAAKPEAHASKSVTYKQKTFTLAGANAKRRLTVRCPGRLVPLGGGMTSSPLPARRRRGRLPPLLRAARSPARLPQHGRALRPLAEQHGARAASPCRSPAPASRGTSPLRTRPSTSIPARPRPPSRPAPGGDTCSVAASSAPTSPRAAATTSPTRTRSPTSPGASPAAPSGSFGGELTAIAYCWRSKKPLLTEVSAVGRRRNRQVRDRHHPALPGRPPRLRRLQQHAGGVGPA